MYQHCQITQYQDQVRLTLSLWPPTRKTPEGFFLFSFPPTRHKKLCQDALFIPTDPVRLIVQDRISKTKESVAYEECNHWGKLQDKPLAQISFESLCRQLWIFSIYGKYVQSHGFQMDSKVKSNVKKKISVSKYSDTCIAYTFNSVTVGMLTIFLLELVSNTRLFPIPVLLAPLFGLESGSDSIWPSQ